MQAVLYNAHASSLEGKKKKSISFYVKNTDESR